MPDSAETWKLLFGQTSLWGPGMALAMCAAGVFLFWGYKAGDAGCIASRVGLGERMTSEYLAHPVAVFCVLHHGPRGSGTGCERDA